MNNIILLQGRAKDDSKPAEVDVADNAVLTSYGLNDLLKRAHINNQTVDELLAKDGIINLKSAGQFRQIMEMGIIQVILEYRWIFPELFFCGIYTSSLLESNIVDSEASPYALDYFLGNNYKAGGDFCFFLQSVFPQRGLANNMAGYYEDMGKGFYKELFRQEGKEIYDLMSQYFEVMALIVRKALKDLRLENKGDGRGI